MSLERLPDEVFQLLLYYVPPVDNLRGVQLLSRRFYDLSNGSLLWKYHCRTSFRFWRPHHDFPNKLQQKPKEVDWKSLFLVRHGHNITISRLLDEVVASRSSRWRKFERICKFGYDAKDILIQQSHTDESAKDVLARRFGSPHLISDRATQVTILLDTSAAPLSIACIERSRFTNGMDFVPLPRPPAARTLMHMAWSAVSEDLTCSWFMISQEISKMWVDNPLFTTILMRSPRRSSL